jgi:hypothetical protein
MLIGIYQNSAAAAGGAGAVDVNFPIPEHTRRLNVVLANEGAGLPPIQHRVTGVIAVNDGTVNVDRTIANYVTQAGVLNRADANTPTNEHQTAVTALRWTYQPDVNPIEFTIKIQFYE